MHAELPKNLTAQSHCDLQRNSVLMQTELRGRDDSHIMCVVSLSLSDSDVVMIPAVHVYLYRASRFRRVGTGLLLVAHQTVDVNKYISHCESRRKFVVVELL